MAEALRLYGSRMTAYERLEIEHYPEVWYLGLDARKIHGEEGAPQNGGYDDENGSYHKVNLFFSRINFESGLPLKILLWNQPQLLLLHQKSTKCLVVKKCFNVTEIRNN